MAFFFFFQERQIYFTLFKFSRCFLSYKIEDSVKKDKKFLDSVTQCLPIMSHNKQDATFFKK